MEVCGREEKVKSKLLRTIRYKSRNNCVAIFQIILKNNQKNLFLKRALLW